jgi:HTH-type transcriptional regulator, sugar sensing transcriptional regulator
LFKLKRFKYQCGNLSHVIERLKKLGLTGYESQAYIALIKLGDAEADEIALNAKIPMGRIYNVLSSLEEAHLVRAQDTRPRRYACVDPATALMRLSNAKQEELMQASQEIQALAGDLTNELSGVVSRKTERSFWTVAIGNESHELIREIISGSRKELLFFMASRITSERIKKELLKEDHVEILTALYDAIKMGVEVKVILSNDVDFNKLENSPMIKKMMRYIGKEFNCRLATIPATPFDIIDGENVLLQMLNPLDPEELFAVVNVRDAKLAKELRNKFFMIWDKAEVYCGKK